jgi:crotonobetainyl-CoA:carnitine CoA-transferase CaiB-like acyl-CoA transferase
MMAITGEADGAPMKAGYQLVDQTAGLVLAQAIAVALFQRERTGRGTTIAVNLYDTAIFLQSYQFAAYSMTGDIPRRSGNFVPHAAGVGLFKVQDGEVVVNAGIQAHLETLCEILDLAWMVDDERFRTYEDRMAHRDELHALWANRLADRKRDELLNELWGRGLTAAAVRSFDEVIIDEQLAANETFAPMSIGAETVSIARMPYSINGARQPARLEPAPELGRDSRAVLGDLGYADDEIDELRDDGVVVITEP